MDSARRSVMNEELKQNQSITVSIWGVGYKCDTAHSNLIYTLCQDRTFLC